MTCIENLRERLYALERDVEELKQLDSDLKTATQFRKMLLHDLEVD